MVSVRTIGNQRIIEFWGYEDGKEVVDVLFLSAEQPVTFVLPSNTIYEEDA